MINDIITLSFQFSVVAGTFKIVLNDFTCHGNIPIPLMAEDYILKCGGGKIFETMQNSSLLEI